MQKTFRQAHDVSERQHRAGNGERSPIYQYMTMAYRLASCRQVLSKTKPEDDIIEAALKQVDLSTYTG